MDEMPGGAVAEDVLLYKSGGGYALPHLELHHTCINASEDCSRRKSVLIEGQHTFDNDIFVTNIYFDE